MAKITLITDDCKRRTSPNCAGTFTYERKPGRPPVACQHCKTPVRKVSLSSEVSTRPTQGTCGCGKTFTIQPRGRISNRCEDCRANGTVWREDSDGMVQMIQASQIALEEQEKRDAAGDERALALFERMQPLLAKRNREVIVH